MTPPGTWRLTICSDAIGSAMDRLSDHLQALGVAPEQSAIAMLVADEVISNVARCAWPDGGPHDFTLAVSAHGTDGRSGLSLVLEDDGVAFDPTTVAAPDLDLSLEERPVGSLGLHLVRSLSSDVRYCRTGGHNRLEIRLDG